MFHKISFHACFPLYSKMYVRLVLTPTNSSVYVSTPELQEGEDPVAICEVMSWSVCHRATALSLSLSHMGSRCVERSLEEHF